MDATCESCARQEVGLLPVHRVYVVPESWDEPGSYRVVDAVEHWCVSCCSQYPHEAATSDPARP